MFWYQAKHVPERYISNFKPVSFDLVVYMYLSVHSLKVYVLKPNIFGVVGGVRGSRQWAREQWSVSFISGDDQLLPRG